MAGSRTSIGGKRSSRTSSASAKIVAEDGAEPTEKGAEIAPEGEEAALDGAEAAQEGAEVGAEGVEEAEAAPLEGMKEWSKRRVIGQSPHQSSSGPYYKSPGVCTNSQVLEQDRTVRSSAEEVGEKSEKEVRFWDQGSDKKQSAEKQSIYEELLSGSKDEETDRSKKGDITIPPTLSPSRPPMTVDLASDADWYPLAQQVFYPSDEEREAQRLEEERQVNAQGVDVGEMGIVVCGNFENIDVPEDAFAGTSSEKRSVDEDSPHEDVAEKRRRLTDEQWSRSHDDRVKGADTLAQDDTAGADITAKNATAGADIAAQNATAAADITAQNVTAGADITAQNAATGADITAQNDTAGADITDHTATAGADITAQISTAGADIAAQIATASAAISAQIATASADITAQAATASADITAQNAIASDEKSAWDRDRALDRPQVSTTKTWAEGRSMDNLSLDPGAKASAQSALTDPIDNVKLMANRSKALGEALQDLVPTAMGLQQATDAHKERAVSRRKDGPNYSNILEDDLEAELDEEGRDRQGRRKTESRKREAPVDSDDEMTRRRVARKRDDQSQDRWADESDFTDPKCREETRVKRLKKVRERNAILRLSREKSLSIDDETMVKPMSITDMPAESLDTKQGQKMMGICEADVISERVTEEEKANSDEKSEKSQDADGSEKALEGEEAVGETIVDEETMVEEEASPRDVEPIIDSDRDAPVLTSLKAIIIMTDNENISRSGIDLAESGIQIFDMNGKPRKKNRSLRGDWLKS